MDYMSTAVISREEGWWVGWIAEVPGVNAQERSREQFARVVAKEERIHDALRARIDDLRHDAGDDLEVWTNPAGHPRIGLYIPSCRHRRAPRAARETSLPFDLGGAEFDHAVQWMRDHLDRLVSTLHPQLQRTPAGRRPCTITSRLATRTVRRG